MDDRLRELASRLLEHAKCGCATCPDSNACMGEDCTNPLCNLAKDIREAREMGL